MKVCPVCSESFGDEFSFCDIDGTRLRREGADRSSHSRVGSLLGVGLIVAAVVISVVVVKGLIQRPPVAPVVARSAEPQTNSAAAKAAPVETPDTATVDESNVNTNTSPLMARRQDKPQNSNANISAAPGTDPGSAAQPQQAAEATTPQPEPAAIAPPPIRTEAPAVETRSSEPPKDVEPPAEKKEIKQAATKKDDKDSDKKKDDGKEKKKGGGLLRAFKKIFGKG